MPRRFGKTWWGVPLMLLLLVAGGCAFLQGGPGSGTEPVKSAEGTPRSSPEDELSPSSGDRFRVAMSALEGNHVTVAHRHLRGLVGECSSGVWGREALLVLAAIELSPEYGRGTPETAARLAARYLDASHTSTSSIRIAETLYLLAVDLGADPATLLTGSDTPFPVAARFEECDAAEPPGPVRELPTHPGPRTTRAALDEAIAQRDSLAQRVELLTERTAELEAELERIRTLLLPDTVPSGRSDRDDGGPSPDAFLR